MSDKRKGKEAITIRKSDLWKAATFVFAVLFLILLFKGVPRGGVGNLGNGEDEGNVILPSNGGTGINGRALIEENDPVLGNKNAEISIVEFSDFQCPFCARAHTGALADFRNSNYFTSGQINLIYKQFPLTSIHQYAQKAAEASLCAQDQDKFWEYHDVLFANQNALDSASLKSYAIQIGIDSNKFNACLENSEKRSEVSKELAQATAAGGRGTPYFIIVNNKDGSTQTISGAVPWSNFETAINLVK